MSIARLTACEGKALVVLAAVFVSGLALGGVGMRAYEHQRTTLSEQLSPTLETPDTVMKLQELTDALDLTAEQQSRIRIILDESIMSEADLLGQLRDVQTGGRQQILGVLTDEQRDRFDEVTLQAAE